MPLCSAVLKYVSVNVARDYSIWKLHMESDLQGRCLWPFCSRGTTDAKAKRLMMQNFSDDIICDEVPADWGCVLWDSLAAAYKNRMAFKIRYMVKKMETLTLKHGENIEAGWYRMKILRSDPKDCGYKYTDTSIVQRIYRNLKLQLSYKTAMHHLSESVAAVKLAKFKI